MKKKIILVILFLIASLIGTGIVYGFNTLGQINQMVAEPKLDESNLNVNNNLDIDTVNIAVFGIDGRSDIDGDRSDTIMIVSMDFRNGNIRVTSIMRDLLVQIPAGKSNNQTMDKINAAYSYGGPELAVKTLNQNFDLNITDYVIVNFDAMVDTVDALGGVEINVQNEDVVEWTNKYIDDVNDKVGKADPYLTTTGLQTVTGVQALAYARNRYSDDDYHRTERQREVVGQIAQKAFKIDAMTGVNLISKIYPYIKTTLSISEITTYAKAFLGSADKQFLEFRLPTDAYVKNAMINSISYVVPNTLADNVIALHAFIYGPATTAASSTTGTAGTSSSTGSTGTTSGTTAGTTSSGTTSTGTSSSSGTTSSSSSSSYTAYVPSDTVEEISSAIASYAGTSSSSSYTESSSSGSSYDDSSSYSDSSSSGSSSSSYSDSGSSGSSYKDSGSGYSDSVSSGSSSSGSSGSSSSGSGSSSSSGSGSYDSGSSGSSSSDSGSSSSDYSSGGSSSGGSSSSDSSN